jgi:hypothetical protein
MKVHEALAEVMKDVQAVAKKDRNDHQKFNFRGIDAVVNAVGPALRKHGVIVLPEVKEDRFNTVEVGQKRTQMGHAVLRVAYTFVGPEGDSLQCVVAAEAMDSGDKAYPKAMSVAFRTALLQALALPTDEPDPDASSYERAPNRDLSAELQALLAKADDLVDTEKVLAYASQGDEQMRASITRLHNVLAEAAGPVRLPAEG